MFAMFWFCAWSVAFIVMLYSPSGIVRVNVAFQCPVVLEPAPSVAFTHSDVVVGLMSLYVTFRTLEVVSFTDVFIRKGPVCVVSVVGVVMVAFGFVLSMVSICRVWLVLLAVSFIVACHV